MDQPRLFVYGTLRRGFSNQFAQLLHANARFVGNARLPGRLHQLDAYSGVVLSDQPGDWVPGELFELEDPNILTTLDEYEGSDFERTVVTVRLDEGQEAETFVYLFVGKV